MLFRSRDTGTGRAADDDFDQHIDFHHVHDPPGGAVILFLLIVAAAVALDQLRRWVERGVTVAVNSAWRAGI